MKKILSILLVAGMATIVMAVPARRGGVLRTAEDGTEKMVYLNGDECFHYITDENGVWLDESTLEPMSEAAQQARLAAQEESPRAKARRARQETGTERLLAPRGAVILVSFSDKEFSTSHEDMMQWAMGETYTYNGATGSIRQYFIDQSWGQYALDIDVIGPVKVSNTYSYYGSNDSQGDDKHPDEMVVEACKLAHDLGTDFSQYDHNNDGKVDWVVIIYAGKGEADGGAANTIWPHQYELSYTNKAFKLDGKTVDHYCCLNELDGTTSKRNGIGTFCHEFGHVMGLPDLYATNYATHHTLCEWDIMDGGSYNNNGNTPPNYSTYERWFMGWFQPRLINSKCSVILPELHTSCGAVYMTEEGEAVSNILNPSPKTFYLFENRQKTGWDKYLPGAGMMITKVNFAMSKWLNNMVNNTSTSMGVDIMEAIKNTSAYGRATDLYPSGATVFTNVKNYQVSNIAMENKIVTFDVNGGGKEVNLGVENVPSDDIQSTKELREGRVVIIRNGAIYDITGKQIQ